MDQKLHLLKAQLIQKIESCNNLELLNKLLDVLENSSTLNEPNVMYDTKFNLDEELNVALQSIKEGRVHSHKDALEVLNKLV